MLDKATNTLLNDPKALIGGAILALVVLVFIVRRARNTTAGKIADKLVGPVMFLGMIWSADAVWVLTGPKHLDLPTPLRIGMFAVLEFALLVAMLRAKDSMDRIGHTGRYGATAWLIASAIALFGFILGFYEGGPVVAAFRPLVPLMLTKLWWDGVLGDSERKAGSFKWTPRKLLIAMGAIEAGDQDLETVNRDRLIQRMTDLYYGSLYGPEEKREKLRTRLAKLTLDADDNLIREVLTRVGRTSWVTAKPLPYALAQPVAEGDTQSLTHPVTQSIAQPYAPRKAAVEIAPARRAKADTHPGSRDYAPGEDPATQAAQEFLTGKFDSRRSAAIAHGVSDGTVRNRIKAMESDPAHARLFTPAPHPKTNGHPVLASTDS